MSIEGCAHGPTSMGFGPGCQLCSTEDQAAQEADLLLREELAALRRRANLATPPGADWSARVEALRRGDKATETAMRWALVQFVVALDQRRAEDELLAAPENGWRSRSAHDLYDEVIATLTALARGTLEPNVYLEAERIKALEEER